MYLLSGKRSNHIVIDLGAWTYIEEKEPFIGVRFQKIKDGRRLPNSRMAT